MNVCEAGRPDQTGSKDSEATPTLPFHSWTRATNSSVLQLEMVKRVQALFAVSRTADSGRSLDELSPVSQKFRLGHRRRGVINLESAAAHLRSRSLIFQSGSEKSLVCVNAIKAVMDGQNKVGRNHS